MISIQDKSQSVSVDSSMKWSPDDGRSKHRLVRNSKSSKHNWLNQVKMI